MDNIETWFEENGIRKYAIHDSEGTKVAYFNGFRDKTPAFENFENDFQQLSKGIYEVRGFDNEFNQRRRVFSFTKNETPVLLSTNNTQRTNKTQPMTGQFTKSDLEQFRAEAYAQGLKDARFEMLSKQVDANAAEIKAIKEKLNEMIKAYNLNNDDDPTNDVDDLRPLKVAAVAKATNMIKDLNFTLK